MLKNTYGKFLIHRLGPKPSVPMKGVNWMKFSNIKAQKTIFKDMNFVDVELDTQQLESLFKQKTVDKSTPKSNYQISILQLDQILKFEKFNTVHL